MKYKNNTGTALISPAAKSMLTTALAKKPPKTALNQYLKVTSPMKGQ